jgi:hypothetical protein
MYKDLVLNLKLILNKYTPKFVDLKDDNLHYVGTCSIAPRSLIMISTHQTTRWHVAEDNKIKLYRENFNPCNTVCFQLHTTTYRYQKIFRRNLEINDQIPRADMRGKYRVSSDVTGNLMLIMQDS